ncbi:HD domain-containing phosphohydrolase [Pseudodesulfovibrio sp. zrk46]|uniref:HD domain-containing phosphohydrolase n=1 Tax=Pseudodesulfovibrio sp. zrk46 TaxID=2725288 RepID=UPI001449CCA9|nr:HD domain-containing phosphohydrolase [Pseudodesulfovibrio sp. zrk46]QJB57182.1 response regulator [Pseudodesulfovibrio sp. zrk46]
MMNKDYSRHKVLMVDDEANLLDSHRRLLRNVFDVHTALGGEAALEKLEKEGPFVVAVTDIKMPTMSGIELLGKIKELYPSTIRMVLTGYADLEMAISVVNRGDIFRFLTKPCAIEDLTNAIIAGIDQFKMTQASQELAIMRRLNDGLEGTLQAFTRLVEFRDPYTAGHMERTSKLAVLIAERINLPEEKIHGLELAARVHDIGKIAVPAGILNKPGTLNDAEFALIKAHPLVGADIFQTLDTEWPISRIIVEHHERLDGSGYPNGITKESILIESKILSVADVIDAIMTHRPYRKILGANEAIRFLNEMKGSCFDVQCAESGISILQEENIYSEEAF